MNSLLFLSEKNFEYKNLNGENVLCCKKIEGPCLIYFYSNNCKHCFTLTPIFNKLPNNLSGCSFGKINIDDNKSFIMRSQNSTTPINEVPFIIYYDNGIPISRYSGEYDMKAIIDFILRISKDINARRNNGTTIKHTKDNFEISKNTAPVCYLNFKGAYPLSPKK